jgi:hypothetical protein
VPEEGRKTSSFDFTTPAAAPPFFCGEPIVSTFLLVAAVVVAVEIVIVDAEDEVDPFTSISTASVIPF